MSATGEGESETRQLFLLSRRTMTRGLEPAGGAAGAAAGAGALGGGDAGGTAAGTYCGAAPSGRADGARSGRGGAEAIIAARPETPRRRW